LSVILSSVVDVFVLQREDPAKLGDYSILCPTQTTVLKTDSAECQSGKKLHLNTRSLDKEDVCD